MGDASENILACDVGCPSSLSKIFRTHWPKVRTLGTFLVARGAFPRHERVTLATRGPLALGAYMVWHNTMRGEPQGNPVGVSCAYPLNIIYVSGTSAHTSHFNIPSIFTASDIPLPFLQTPNQ